MIDCQKWEVSMADTKLTNISVRILCIDTKHFDVYHANVPRMMNILMPR